MQKTFCLAGLIFVVFLSICLHGICQGYEDSIMLAHSMPSKIEPKKELVGLSKPSFGNFTTLSVSKMDSGFHKKKVKDSSSFDLELGNGENDMDQSKYMTIQKIKWYQLLLASDSGTTNVTFAIASVSKEKRQTFLGKMLSRNDEGKDQVLNYYRDVPGLISVNDNSAPWEFLITNFTSGSRLVGGFTVAPSISSGYLKNENDSLGMQIYSSFSADIVLVNRSGEHLAAIKFKQKPFFTWIRNDINKEYRNAIAGLFAVMISIIDF